MCDVGLHAWNQTGVLSFTIKLNFSDLWQYYIIRCLYKVPFVAYIFNWRQQGKLQTPSQRALWNRWNFCIVALLFICIHSYQNLENTCHLSVFLQSCFRTPVIRYAIYAIQDPSSVRIPTQVTKVTCCIVDCFGTNFHLQIPWHLSSWCLYNPRKTYYVQNYLNT